MQVGTVVEYGLVVNIEALGQLWQELQSIFINITTATRLYSTLSAQYLRHNIPMKVSDIKQNNFDGHADISFVYFYCGGRHYKIDSRPWSVMRITLGYTTTCLYILQ